MTQSRSRVCRWWSCTASGPCTDAAHAAAAKAKAAHAATRRRPPNKDEADALLRAQPSPKLDELLGHDQLLKDDLAPFSEAPIAFAPTYKFDKGTDIYDTSKKKRAPAWSVPHARIRIHVHACLLTCAFTCTCACTLHAHEHTCMCSCMHACIL